MRPLGADERTDSVSTMRGELEEHMGLDGKLALVTGASRPHGIGRATALALARAGADVVVTGLRNMDGALSVAQEIASLGRIIRLST